MECWKGVRVYQWRAGSPGRATSMSSTAYFLMYFTARSCVRRVKSRPFTLNGENEFKKISKQQWRTGVFERKKASAILLLLMVCKRGIMQKPALPIISFLSFSRLIFRTEGSSCGADPLARVAPAAMWHTDCLGIHMLHSYFRFLHDQYSRFVPKLSKRVVRRMRAGPLYCRTPITSLSCAFNFEK